MTSTNVPKSPPTTSVTGDRLTVTRLGVFHASGPECFQRALELLDEAGDCEEYVDQPHTGDPDEWKCRARSLREEAAVYAQLAEVATRFMGPDLKDWTAVTSPSTHDIRPEGEQ